jgi:hypothetical protein
LSREDNLKKIAALFVESGGSYFDLDIVDPWDEIRDARRYEGPYPVIAHPPCQRWGKFWAGSPVVIARTGKRKIKGDDDGCFASALIAVRNFGGVLEHPEGSHAWAAYGLNRPSRMGGWIAADTFGGFTCCVEQGRYGHYARKPTWLYVVGVDLPELSWGKSESRFDPALIERIGIKKAKRMGEVCSKGGGPDSSQRIATPRAFRDLLIEMALSVK